jgi:hypothetical protein
VVVKSCSEGSLFGGEPNVAHGSQQQRLLDHDAAL